MQVVTSRAVTRYRLGAPVVVQLPDLALVGHRARFSRQIEALFRLPTRLVGIDARRLGLEAETLFLAGHPACAGPDLAADVRLIESVLAGRRPSAGAAGDEIRMLSAPSGGVDLECPLLLAAQVEGFGQRIRALGEMHLDSEFLDRGFVAGGGDG